MEVPECNTADRELRVLRDALLLAGVQVSEEAGTRYLSLLPGRVQLLRQHVAGSQDLEEAAQDQRGRNVLYVPKRLDGDEEEDLECLDRQVLGRVIK